MIINDSHKVPTRIGSHGFVQLEDIFGVEYDILKAARVSYGNDGKDPDAVPDRHLIRYLMRHRHTSPFEQVELKFILQIPMDAWRQMVRHRTANLNEYSTRYMPAIDEMAITPFDEWRVQSNDSKQGSDGTISEEVGGKSLAS